jgi:hypothetical protein
MGMVQPGIKHAIGALFLLRFSGGAGSSQPMWKKKLSTVNRREFSDV